ncbi:MAG: M14 family zinc carboxypeptidase [Planctomycetota bacterium]|jgi:protein MpaA
MNRQKRCIVIFWALLPQCLLCGCGNPVGKPQIVDDRQFEPAVYHRVVGRSNEGRVIDCRVMGRGRDVTLILAAIHGDEPTGTVLVNRLAEYLPGRPDVLHKHKVVLLPVANPDGIARNNRLNSRGVDLNRNFPAKNRYKKKSHGPAALSEPEARVIESLIRKHNPNRIISIHQLTETGPQAISSRVPAGCIDYDGPAKELAELMAENCDLPVVKLGAQPGSLGSYAGLTLRIKVITLELPLDARMLGPELVWARYGRALVAAIEYGEAAR